MELQYQRDVNRNYLILNGVPVEDSYEAKMLEENEIQSLLSFYRVHAGNQIQYWYDITGMKSIRDVVAQEGLDERLLYQIIIYLGLALEELNQYLLGKEKIILSPDTVFFSRSGKESGVRLCYYPGGEEDFSMAMLQILQLFLEEVDHEKEKVAKACYDLYEIASQGDFSYGELTERVREFDGMIVEDGGAASFADPGFISEENCTWEEKEGNLVPWENPEWNTEEPWEIIDSEEKKGFHLPFRLGGIGDRRREKKERREKEKALKKEGKKPFRLREISLFQKKFRNDRLEKPEDFLYDPAEDYEEETLLLKPGTGGSRRGRMVYEGSGEEGDFIIEKELFRVGTDQKENDGVLHSKVVSRRHAKIRMQGSTLYIEDLNSRNGTFVNGHILSFGMPVQLKEGDQVLFADQPYRFLGFI